MPRMKKTTVFWLGLAALFVSLPTASSAQVRVGIGIAFPEPPPLVVVSPGIQVVPEYDEEVFFTGGWYWVRRDDGWYRTHDWHGGWAPARREWVPSGLARIPPGRYRHYYRDDDGRWRGHSPDEFHTWRDRHPVEERRDFWRQHRNDPRVRYEPVHSGREQQRTDRGPRGGPPPPNDNRRDHDDRRDQAGHDDHGHFNH